MTSRIDLGEYPRTKPFPNVADHGSILAVCFKVGDIYLMSGYDDLCPCTVHTTLQGTAWIRDWCYNVICLSLTVSGLAHFSFFE